MPLFQAEFRIEHQAFQEGIPELTSLGYPPLAVLQDQERAFGLDSDGQGDHGILLPDSDDTRAADVSCPAQADQIFRQVQILFPSRERDDQSIRKESPGAAVPAELQHGVEIVAGQQRWNAPDSGIAAGDSPARMLSMEAQDPLQQGLIHGGLIADQEDRGDGFRRERRNGGPEGAGHAFLPVQVLDALHRQLTQGRLHLFRFVAKDHEHRSADLEGDPGHAVEEEFPIDGDQLLRLPQAPGRPCSEDDGWSLHIGLPGYHDPPNPPMEPRNMQGSSEICLGLLRGDFRHIAPLF
jgi:hypothetical protein